MIRGSAAVSSDGTISYAPRETEIVEMYREQYESLARYYIAVNRVRDLHKLSECDKKYCRGENCPETCEECDQDYPCDTIKALDGEQE